ncbi:unnamed protein product [Closterium sp. Naga37s-1]|nr:unnamed protein product [Closterium sp. Naga37s-1]
MLVPLTGSMYIARNIPLPSLAFLTPPHPTRCEHAGQSMLVPLTGSMYIAGTVAEPSHVLIDVGAGYYIEKSVEEAMGYCMRKAELLRANHDKFSEVARAKRQLLEEVTMVLQAKVRAAVQQQGGEAAGAVATGAAQAGRIQAAAS